eukprot:3440467-Prymnesium_polylepis.2
MCPCTRASSERVACDAATARACSRAPPPPPPAPMLPSVAPPTRTGACVEPRGRGGALRPAAASKPVQSVPPAETRASSVSLIASTLRATRAGHTWARADTWTWAHGHGHGHGPGHGHMDTDMDMAMGMGHGHGHGYGYGHGYRSTWAWGMGMDMGAHGHGYGPVSYTHLRAHETLMNL